MELIATPATEIAKCSGSLLGHHIGLFLCYKIKFEDLSDKLKDLSEKKNEINGRVSDASRRGDTTNELVNIWLKKVETVINDSAKLKAEKDTINCCFKGWCCGRYGVGKTADKLIAVVTGLLSEWERIHTVSVPVYIPDIVPIPTNDYKVYESTKKARDIVMKALRDPSISIIGVHGMGGIGKTTLMTSISNEVNKTIFDVVVIVTVSQNPDLKSIQEVIAGDLALNFGREGVPSRARILFHRLKKEMSILIILDDMWKSLDLDQVGIPSRKNHKGCKVVLTTRRQEVCTTMNVETQVELRILSEQDSWHLFQKKAGAEVDSPHLKEVAELVASECNGLPVALVTLGSSMRRKNQAVWEHVLKRLRESDFKYIEDMDVKVFGPIKLSYDYLHYENAKLVFLFCCIFPEDHKISVNELLSYTIGEELLDDTTNISQAKRELELVIDYLTSSHLLLKGDKDGFILMHDVIRDVAINIASSDHGFIVKAGRGFDAWPAKKILPNCKRLSLIGSQLTKLPEQPICPNILTLSLSRCQALKQIPDSFFKGMTSLVNLDLSHTPILSIPSSVIHLKNLRSLSLDGCSRLKDFSMIRKLDTLEIISLRNCSVKNIPLHDIKKFRNLKFLYTDTCQHL